MKTTLDLPDELVREVKLRAVVQGRTVKDLVTEMLSQALGLSRGGQGSPPSVSTRVQPDDKGLPVVRCASRAPASAMSLKDLLDLEQQSQSQEDLHRAGLPRGR